MIELDSYNSALLLVLKGHRLKDFPIMDYESDTMYAQRAYGKLVGCVSDFYSLQLSLIEKLFDRRECLRLINEMVSNKWGMNNHQHITSALRCRTCEDLNLNWDYIEKFNEELL